MLPLVSAILPTRGRAAMALRAVHCFLAQTYANRELVILDDIHERSFPEGIESMPIGKERIIYLMHESRSIAEKRNLCIGYSRGEIIVHIDSDDHSEPARLADQVKLLTESGKAVCGFHSMLFFDETTRRATKYLGDHQYSLGTSLMYLKSWASDHPFRPGHPDANVGEDNTFVKEARDAGQLIAVDAGQLMVARSHADNTSRRNPEGLEYRPVPIDAIPQGFFA